MHQEKETGHGYVQGRRKEGCAVCEPSHIGMVGSLVTYQLLEGQTRNEKLLVAFLSLLNSGGGNSNKCRCVCVQPEVLWGGLQEMTKFNSTGYAVETVHERQQGILWNVNSCG